ncbi:class I SAM-dependent DNA methyltransferase [Roseiconus lacunae]|uniref:Methyltransferase domain-containing protein n=1 Tax=Roseiconus lacunae TaxID=2605694 RepID=A0ABT7PC21_9BACT|nr:methyltransferase domain-containing protein [Roseiconus lacunae]MDM4014045.1 methyltransferase domain-containing protein [Roseiconus lacunae]WRQ53339.1 methyltransferase domain-containing protein [Stieleria sp. HD01]
MSQHYRIQFPPDNSEQLQQDEVFFTLVEDNHATRLRFHDYAEIYRRPGLYEQLFYERLRCNSPEKVAELLQGALDTVREPISELRVIDLGAGNGMMGEVLKRNGVARLVGVDLIPEARDAAYRDRSTVYDDYYVEDLTELASQTETELREWRFDCLTCVAALGFGDIPPRAFFNAMKLVRTDGWLAFNIKVSFLDHAEQTGFSKLVRELIFSKYLDIYHLELYRHRLSMEGTQLFYYGLVGRMTDSIPDDFLEQHGID